MMKKMFLLVGWMCMHSMVSPGQQAEVFNKYRSVFIPQLYYEKDKIDIYGIRQTLIDKLNGSGVPLFLDEKELTRTALKDPCTILHCLIQNTAPANEVNKSGLFILFFDCNNDTVLLCSAMADLFPTIKETRSAFIHATGKALTVFNGYRYQADVRDAAPVQVNPVAGEDSIRWSAERKLSWDDFRGTAGEDDPADALTYTANHTSFTSFGVGSRFEVESEVQCYFIKSKSWVKPGRQVDFLLDHEQRHFDLAEAGAREFRKKLKQTTFHPQQFRDQLKRITRDVHEKYHELQEQYDRETDHSRMKEKQLEWNRKIDALLKDLESYK